MAEGVGNASTTCSLRSTNLALSSTLVPQTLAFISALEPQTISFSVCVLDSYLISALS